MQPHEHMAVERAQSLERILHSNADHRLIVAGPGSGKTYTFQKVIQTLDEAPLILTFLRLLVADLDDELGDSAVVHSFHGFARWSLHVHGADGLSSDIDYYPGLVVLQVEDLHVRGTEKLSVDDLGGLFRELAHDPALGLALESGSYYDAVGHDDSVYRVLRRMESRPDSTPTYPLVLVDEFQDFSPLEVALIQALSKANPTLIVGDDDQALYSFRNATPDAIRALHEGDEYENFELPYCSRCTEVVVAATQTVVEHAQAFGLLDGRIEKRYICYRPDKEADSLAHPQILHAHCSTQRANAPYMGRYIAGRIRDIPQADIDASRAGGYPTVLVVGPKPFLPQVEAWLREHFNDVSGPSTSATELRAEDAYRRLRADEASRLGWRILMHLRRPAGWEQALDRALGGGEELRDLLPDAFVTAECRLLDLYTRAVEGHGLTDSEWMELEAALEEPRDQLEARFTEEPDPEPPSVASDSPSIMLTSLMGSKGLQAEHVFIVGINDGHFPRSNDNPTNVEVCQLLVALTRTRKSCTLVSTQRLGGTQLRRSIFADWIGAHVHESYIDKQFLEEHAM